MNNVKKFIDGNRKKIKKGIIVTASVAGGSLLLYTTYMFGVYVGTVSVGEFIYKALKDGNCEEGINIVAEAIKNFNKQ